MKLCMFLSEFIIPFLVFYIVAYGLLQKKDIFGDFLEGAQEGLKTVMKICPSLIGLMIATGILQASGFMDFFREIIRRIFQGKELLAELFPLTFVRMFSSSAATGFLLDIFKEYGTDSQTGKAASLMMCATESVFYCISVYFGAVKIKKIRYTITGAILSTAAGLLTALWAVRLF